MTQPEKAVTERLQTPETLQLSEEEAFALDLTASIAEAVRPVYGIKQKDVPVSQRSKDFNYALDEVTEGRVKNVFSKEWKRRSELGKRLSAYITEDQGYVEAPGENAPEFIYLIDPVDGSRPAMSGTEQACVTMVAVKGDKKDAKFSDIEFGITHFIKEGVTLFVRRGSGVWAKGKDGKMEKVKAFENPPTNLKDCSMTTESYSFNKMITGAIYDPLARSVGYEISAPSGSWSAASLVRGHNEIQVDVRDRLIRDFPEFGNVIKYDPVKSKGGYPMDVAASVTMIEELGGKVTDAYGNSLSDKPLWGFDEKGDWHPGNQISIVAAITPQLHDLAMQKINEGFEHVFRTLNAS